MYVFLCGYVLSCLCSIFIFSQIKCFHSPTFHHSYTTYKPSFMPSCLKPSCLVLLHPSFSSFHLYQAWLIDLMTLTLLSLPALLSTGTKTRSLGVCVWGGRQRANLHLIKCTILRWGGMKSHKEKGRKKIGFISTRERQLFLPPPSTSLSPFLCLYKVICRGDNEETQRWAHHRLPGA